MQDQYLYIIYLLTWRISIVACGALSIFLGYRLFTLGYQRDTSEMEAKYGEYAITFRNFAPGTAFALFGAVLIGVMVATSPAEVIVQPTRSVEEGVVEDGGGGLILRSD